MGIANVAHEGLLDLLEAVVDVLCRALDKHLDCAVGQIPHEARGAILLGDLLGRVAKAYALNLTAEDDVFRRLIHFKIEDSLFKIDDLEIVNHEC